MKTYNNEREYADLNREIEMKCRKAKEDYQNNKCLEIEQVSHVAPKVDDQKIREITG